jgi:hypothetical protein
VEDLNNKDNDIGYTEKYRNAKRELFKELKSCHTCGQEKICKINRHGKHTELSVMQVRAWVTALVSDWFKFYKISDLLTILSVRLILQVLFQLRSHPSSLYSKTFIMIFQIHQSQLAVKEHAHSNQPLYQLFRVLRISCLIQLFRQA